MTDHPEERLSGFEIRRRAAAGVMSITVRTVGLKMIGAAGTLALARLLTPRAFGDIAFGTALLAFGALFADSGIASGLVRRPREPTRQELGGMLGLNLLLAAGMALVIVAVGLFLGRPGRLAAIMGLALPLDALRVPYTIPAERTLRYGVFVWAQVAEVVAWNAIAVLAVTLGMGVWGVAIAGPLRALIGSLATIKISDVAWLRPRLAFRSMRPLIRFGVVFQASNLVSLLRDEGMYLVVAATSGFVVLGVWNLTTSVVAAITVGYLSLWQVAMPGIARLMEAGEEVKPAIEQALRLITGATGGLCAALAGTAPAAVPIFLGLRWHSMVPLLAYAAGGVMLGFTIPPIATGYFYAVNRPRLPLNVVIIHTISLFAITVPLLSSLGVDALGIGLLVAQCIDGLLLGWALSRERIAVVRSCAVPIALAAIAGTAAWIVAKAIADEWLALAASAACAEGLYLGGLVLIRRRLLGEIVEVFRRHMLTRTAVRGVVAD